MFADADNPTCRSFLERVFQADEISNVTISGGSSPQADLHYCPRTSTLQAVVKRIVGFLNGDTKHGKVAPNGQGHANSNGHASNGHASSGHAVPHLGHHPRRHDEVRGPLVAEAITARDRKGMVRYYRHDSIVTGWEIKETRAGRPAQAEEPGPLPQERALPGDRTRADDVLGIDKYKTSSIRCTVQVDYDPRQLTQAPGDRDSRLGTGGAEHPTKLDKLDLHLPFCTASLPLAAAAQFAFPPLLPVAAAVFAYTSIPTFRDARKCPLRGEAARCRRARRDRGRRLPRDDVDLPGAVLCWCLSFGRVLVKRTQDNSKKLLLNAFGKQPRYVWLYRDGAEVQVSLDKLQKGDIIVVNTGEVVPVDGHVVEGMAMIDQHALTGESTPAEKGVGDRVFASTVMVAGKVFVSVETSGSDTASAKISQILNDTAGYKLASQHKGERLADKAVIPTLAIGAVGLATMGPAGAVAVLNSDFGTGIRMAAPLAMLSSLALCANKGMLVKDGRAWN